MAHELMPGDPPHEGRNQPRGMVVPVSVILIFAMQRAAPRVAAATAAATLAYLRI